MKIKFLYIAIIIMNAIAAGLNLAVALYKNNGYNLVAGISFTVLAVVYVILYHKEVKNK